MRLLRAADHRRMPWRNGGGETREVAVAPEGASLDVFDWRISMATVAVDGPFSIFPGVDRTLVLLDGAGMTLAIAGRGVVTLDRVSAPCAFAADQPVTATLIDGPITDLNVMTARGRWTHDVRRVGEACDLVAGAGEELLVLGDGGSVAMAAERVVLDAGDVVRLEPGERAHAAPASGGALLLVAIRPVG